MIKKYLKLTCLSALTLTILSGCASKNNNNTATTGDSTATVAASDPEPAQSVDDGIDWEKPLYEIQSNGDTAYRLEYDAKGRISKKFADYYEENRCGCIVNYNYDDNGNLTSYVYYDPISDSEIETTDTYTYDSQNRLVETYYGADGGEETSTTKYEGNKSTETRILSMIECEPKKTITEKYFDANNNDTLIVVNSQEEGLSETRISYVSIGGKYLVKSSETKRKAKNGKWEVAETTTNEYNADGTLSKQIYENTAMTSNSTYEYDNAGRLIKSVTKSNYKEDNSSDTDEITYKYTGNCRECSNGIKTYFKKK